MSERRSAPLAEKGQWVSTACLVAWQRLEEQEAMLLDQLARLQAENARQAEEIDRLKRTVIGLAERSVIQGDLLARIDKKEGSLESILRDTIFAPDLGD